MAGRDGGAPNPAIRNRARRDRDVSELIGLCRGILADGVVSLEEANYLLGWLEDHREHATHFPFSVLYPRVAAALEDGVLDAEEESELLGLLVSASAVAKPRNLEKASAVSGVAVGLSAALPLRDPPPSVVHEGRRFVVTGKFYSGDRKQVQGEIEKRGGRTASSPSGKTDYLVVGTIGSSDWVHSTHGRKIEAAIRLREEGKSIAILSEEHWLSQLD